jgi:hypothetical protein
VHDGDQAVAHDHPTGGLDRLHGPDATERVT